MGKKKTLLFTTLAVLVLLFMIFSFYRFYATIQKNEAIIQQTSLQTIAKREASLGDLKLIGYFDTLRAIVEFVDDGALLSEEHISHLQELQSKLEFQKLGLITPEGQLHLADGEIMDITDRSYYHQLLMGQTSVTDMAHSKLTDTEMFSIVMPVTLENGDITGGVLGAFSLEQFQSNEGWWARGSSQASYVIDQNGNYILGGTQEDDPFFGHQNLLEHIEAADGCLSSEELREKLTLQQDMMETIIVDGVSYLMVFSPLQFSSWYSIVAMPSAQLSRYSEGLLSADLLPLVLQILIATGLFCTVLITVMMREAERERRKEKTLRKGLTTGIIGYVEVDLDDNRVLHCSDNNILTENIHLPFTDYTQKIISGYIHPDYQENAFAQLCAANVRKLFNEGITDNTLSFFVQVPGHGIVWIECETHAMQNENDGHLMAYYTLHNITDKKTEERKLKEKAERDGLTGLYNRTTATDAINSFLNSGANKSYEQHAFIILDLDNFKNLNDTLGHKTGDVALQNVAGILTNYFRKEDIICRLGGDEFVIFLKRIAPAVAEEKVKNLLPRLHLSYSSSDEEENEVQISASIGITYNNPGDDFKSLYQKADEALYRAKESGRDTFKVNRA